MYIAALLISCRGYSVCGYAHNSSTAQQRAIPLSRAKEDVSRLPGKPNPPTGYRPQSIPALGKQASKTWSDDHGEELESTDGRPQR